MGQSCDAALPVVPEAGRRGGLARVPRHARRRRGVRGVRGVPRLRRRAGRRRVARRGQRCAALREAAHAIALQTGFDFAANAGLTRRESLR